MVSENKAAAILEERTGHRFLNLKRLERALTHSSVQAPSRANYERLEFLGDRVLGLVVAEMLFEAFPDAPEGNCQFASTRWSMPKPVPQLPMRLVLPI